MSAPRNVNAIFFIYADLDLFRSSTVLKKYLLQHPLHGAYLLSVVH